MVPDDNGAPTQKVSGRTIGVISCRISSECHTESHDSTPASGSLSGCVIT